MIFLVHLTPLKFLSPAELKWGKKTAGQELQSLCLREPTYKARKMDRKWSRDNHLSKNALCYFAQVVFGFPEVEIPVQGHGTQFLKRINRHKRRKEIEWRLALQGGRNREQQTQAVQVQPEFSQLFLRPGFPLLVPHRPDSNQGHSECQSTGHSSDTGWATPLSIKLTVLVFFSLVLLTLSHKNRMLWLKVRAKSLFCFLATSLEKYPLFIQFNYNIWKGLQKLLNHV